MSDTAAASPRYRAFISYSHRDARWSRWLHRALEAYRVPRRLVGRPTRFGPVPRRLAPIFRDREELPSANDLSAKVQQALAASDSLIVICSPQAARSRWVNEEILAYRRLGRSQRIFCLIVAGEPFADATPDRAAQECFPPALRCGLGAGGAPGQEPAEPIAADLRRHADGRQNAKLKLIAGMLDLGLDELRQREQQRRQRQLLAVAGLSLAGMSVAIGLSVVAWTARVEAQRQRAEAEALIEFMLGDLRTRLEGVGRLDVLDAVGERALRYYRDQNLQRLDADALGRRARAMHLLGEIEMARGELARAEAGFREAEQTTRERLAREPQDPERIFEHAQSVYWLGSLHWEQARLDQAEARLREYLQLAERLFAVAPDDPRSLAERQYALSNLGTLLVSQAQVANAVPYFEAALHLADALAAREPQAAWRQHDLAQAHAWLADARGRVGPIERAVRHHAEQASIYRRLTDRQPRDARYRALLLSAVISEAEARRSAGELAASAALLREVLVLADALAAQDQDNLTWQARRALGYLALAETELLRADAEAARAALAQAQSGVQAVQGHADSALKWQLRVLFREQMLRARLAALDGRRAEARAQLRAAIAGIEALDGASQAEEIDRALAHAYLLLGDLEAALGEPQSAEALWTATRLLAAQIEPLHRLEALALGAQANERLGDAGTARSLREQAAQLGYRGAEFAPLAPLAPPAVLAAADTGRP